MKKEKITVRVKQESNKEDLTSKDIDKLDYRELQSLAKEVGVPANTKASLMRIEIKVKLGMKEVADLEKIRKRHQKSQRGRASRQKGQMYEREIARVFSDALKVDFRRTPMSGGFASTKSFAGDITPVDDTVDNFRLHIECKNHRTWSVPAWWRQATEETPEGQIPTVIMKKDNTNPPGEKGNQQNLILLELEDFLDLIDKDKLIKIKE